MMPKAKLAERILTKAAGGYFTALLLILVLCEGAFQGYYRSGSLLSNAVLLLIAFAVGAGLLWLSRACRRPSGARFEKRLWLYFAALLAVQCVIARSIYFYPAWDIESVYCNAQLLAEGGAVEQSYFQLCGNNAPISMLLAAPLWLAGKLGLAVPYAVLPYLGALAINAACFVGMLCVCRLTDHFAVRLFALIVETLWIALTMMMTIPYTDTFSVLFPMLALYVYLGKRRGLGRWLLISLWCGLGATLKPTVMIVWIAIVLTEAFSRLPWHRLNRVQWKRRRASRR